MFDFVCVREALRVDARLVRPNRGTGSDGALDRVVNLIGELRDFLADAETCLGDVQAPLADFAMKLLWRVSWRFAPRPWRRAFSAAATLALFWDWMARSWIEGSVPAALSGRHRGRVAGEPHDERLRQ